MAKRQNSPFGGFTWLNPPAGRVTVTNITEANRHQPWQDMKIQHDDWVVDYFHTEGLKVKVGSASAPWKVRDAYVVHLYAPGTTYWEDIRSMPGTVRSAWVNFRLSGIPEFEELTKALNGFAQFIDPEREIEGLLHRMYVIGTALGDEGYWDIMPDFHTLLRHLMRAIPLNPGTYRISRLPLSATEHPLVAKVQDFLRSNLTTAIDIGDIAKHVNMSVSGLIRRYRVETGETPMKTLRRIRVETSKTLIIQGSTLASIARQFQFYDAYHFSKAFKHIEGMAPSVYLSRVRDEQLQQKKR